MKQLRVVLPVKMLLALIASFLLWMGAFLPVQAQSLHPQATCSLVVHGIPLTITVKGSNAELLCELALHDPKITKAFGPLGGLYETHRKPHGHVWCKRPFSGITLTIRSDNPAIGKTACKGLKSA